jgi:subtilisin family serine protease
MIFILLFNFLSFYNSHNPVESSGRWLVELNSGSATCLDQWWNDTGLSHSKFHKKALPVESWFVVEIPDRLVTSISSLSCVMMIAPDQRMVWRNTEPNDPAYINQYNMNLIGMPKAWDIATGGLSSRGDTIVVAIVDDGYDIDHIDLLPNLWLNFAEIPGDNIDNDNNGYVDDFKGLNVATGNDVHAELKHGTEVSGIIGAKGNNLTGISGVNWNIKLMLISGADYESEVIEGYQYALDLRKKYNQTNGNEGAFVVATNLSGGIDRAFAADHPLWCEMYDKMGETGILSVAAAPNNAVSVDVVGDMPTTCTSPYLITVTNTDQTDVLVDDAGFGSVSIDLAAPGESVLTTTLNSQFISTFSGTSASAPHVSGTIGLMYASPCSTLLDNVNSDPAGVALRMKDLIFSSAKHNNSLQGMTLTGKRLQTDAALKATITECSTTVVESIRILGVSPNPASLEWAKVYFEVKGDTSSAVFDLYSINGARINSFPISTAEFQQGYIEIDTGPLAAAVYLVTLRNKKQKATSKLFVY